MEGCRPGPPDYTGSMRVLICSMESPLPPIDGHRLQLRHLLQELRAEHQVRLLALVLPEQLGREGRLDDARLIPRPAPTRFKKALKLPPAMLRGRPLNAAEMADRLRPALREEIGSFRPDVVHVTPGEVAALSDGLEGTPGVLGALDAWHLNTEADILEARGLRRWLLRGELQRVRRFEGFAYGRYDTVLVVSEADGAALRQMDPTLRVAVVPNGVDLERFSPDPSVPKDPGRMVLTGVMDYAPNVRAAEFLARRVLPLVRARRPEAHLVLVGRSPADRITALGSLDGVRVIGEVAELRPWLAGSAVYVCPMLTGTGIKNKLLEAMACEVPCVATPLALRGTSAGPGRELLVGETAEELAHGVLRILDDPALGASLARSARQYVRAEHSWSAVARAHVGVYEGAIDRAATNAAGC